LVVLPRWMPRRWNRATRTVAVRLCPLTKDVGKDWPFHWTTDPATKPRPPTVNLTAFEPGWVLVGERGWVIEGRGFVVANISVDDGSKKTAMTMRYRFTFPPLVLAFVCKLFGTSARNSPSPNDSIFQKTSLVLLPRGPVAPRPSQWVSGAGRHLTSAPRRYNHWPSI
jgi:hypothetical protein